MGKVRREDQKKGIRGDRRKKRKQHFNPKLNENVEKSFTSSSAKKIKIDDEINVPESAIQYKIIDFMLVFSAISNLVTCSKIIDNKICNGKVNFSACNKQGLGFKIELNCEKCNPTYIDSGKKIGQSYEINRRFIFVMRLLGLGLAGCNKFCGLMDLSCSFLTQTVYDSYINKILECVRTVTDKLLSFAVNAEKNEMCAETGIDSSDLTVSGDGTWKKRGFTSLFGVTSVIGYYSGKVLDVFCKSSYCNQCEFWKKKFTTAEFEEWHNEHVESNECTANHEGPSGNMEVQAILKLFERSHDKNGVKYRNYIGDGDAKVYKKVIEAQPYGQHYQINKKECVGHVQKRMGARLRELVRNTVEDKKIKNKTIKKKILSGKGRLTAKLIDKLTVYYGLAIRRNSNSVEKMKDAIWATFLHYSSSDNNPQHEKCPSGKDSWCAWQRAAAADELETFQHDYNPLPADVLEAMRPVYKDLSNDVLLERCVGGFTQNNNESYNQLVWKIAPKSLHAGAKVVEVAANVAAGIFNEGNLSVLLFLNSFDVKPGQIAHEYARREDENRISKADRKTQAATQEERIRRRMEQKDALDVAAAAGELLYGAGIDDSI